MNNPLALKVIADLYAKKGEFQLATALCERGLQILESYRRPEQTLKENPNYRKEIEYLRSDFYFIMGKVQHMQRSFAMAQDLYQKAIKKNERNYSAQFNLGKVYFMNDSYQQAEGCLEIVISASKLKDCFEAIRLLALTKKHIGKT